jgi:hypothetical protein
MTTPAAVPQITPGMRKLALQINMEATPVSIPIRPGAECLLDRCFENVRETITRHGGSLQCGWRLREQPLAYVEGEFHAVWRREDGVLIDVTPRPDEADAIVFVPDPKMRWTGDPVEPRRMMLNQQPCYCGSGMSFKLCHGGADA